MRLVRIAIAALVINAATSAAHAAGPSFAVSFPASMSAAPLDGRVILLVAKGAPKDEPRTLVSPDEPLKSPFIFGLTVDGLKPGASAVLDASAFGWPAASLSVLKAGDYTVQAVLNRYETFHRADGKILKLPPEMGEGQQWAKKPGNLYSKPMKIHLDPAHDQRVTIVLDQKIAAIPDDKDTPFVRHVKLDPIARARACSI